MAEATAVERANIQADRAYRLNRARQERFDAQRSGQPVPGTLAEQPEALSAPGEGNRLQRAARLRALQSVRRKGLSLNPETAVAEANQIALQAWRRAWQTVHEVVEDLSFQFFGLLSIVIGPVVIALFLIRWVGGHWLNGISQIGVPSNVPLPPGMDAARDLHVPLVPSFSAAEAVYRTSKVVFISLITGILWGLIIFILYFIFHPLDFAQLGLGALADLLKSFGSLLTQ